MAEANEYAPLPRGGTLDDAARLAEAAANALERGFGLLITQPLRIASAVGTISVPVRFLYPGAFDLQTGGSVTLAEKPEASSMQQIFQANGGTVTLGAATEIVYTAWWGPAGDGVTNDSAPLQAALNTLAAGNRTLVFQAGKTHLVTP